VAKLTGHAVPKVSAGLLRLARSWNGRTHVVVIDEAGVIRWNEQEWRSLCEVARAITRTRWSALPSSASNRKSQHETGPLRDLHPQIEQGRARAGFQFAARPA